MNSLSTPVAGPQRLRGLATAAAVLVWIAGAPGPLAVFASSFTFGASASTATAQTGFVLLGAGLIATYLGCAVAGIVVILWLWRARANAAAAGTAPQRWSEGWVIAGWLVPFVNLWVPAAVVSDVVRASAGRTDPQADRLRAIVPFWWAAWLGAWVALSAALLGIPMVGASANGAARLGATYLWFSLFSGLAALLFIGAAAAFTRIALQVAQRQDAHLGAPAAPGPGTWAGGAAVPTSLPPTLPGAVPAAVAGSGPVTVAIAGPDADTATVETRIPAADPGGETTTAVPTGSTAETVTVATTGPAAASAGDADTVTITSPPAASTGGPTGDAATVVTAGTDADPGTVALGRPPESASPPPPFPPAPPFPPPYPFPQPPPSSGGRTRLLLAVVGVVVFAIAATAVALIATDEPPADVVAAAVEDAREWDGANYRGTVPALDGSPIEFDVTVTATGARGTLLKPGGARAEVVRDASGVLLKGNQQWWQRSQPDRAELLADTWVADPGSETLAVDPILRLHPEELAGEVHPELGSLWEETGEQVVDGEPAIVLSNGFQVLIVTAEEPHRLLLIDLNSLGVQEDEPIRIGVITPAQAAEVAAFASRIRISESPRTLTEWLVLQPEADIQVQPEPLCATRTCTATFTVTNTGEIRIRGRFEMSADGQAAGTYPVDLLPGQSVTFTGNAPNRLFDSPGATGQIYWRGQVIPD